MRVDHIEIVDSPDRPGRVRLTAEVAYADGSAEQYWFEADQAYRQELTTQGSPWLACLLPLAMAMKEPLEIGAPVDPVLFEGAQQVVQIWTTWYPQLGLRPIPLRAEILPIDGRSAGIRAASFFSGGVDSFFTAIRHQNGASPPGLRLDDLILMWGMDLPIRKPEAFARAHETASRAAQELGKNLVVMATNVRETRWQRANWGFLGHAAILGAAALVLEPRYRAVMIASTSTYGRMRPWGSHPLTDPLFSSSRLRLIHDGAFATRFEKVAELIKHDVAMRNLRTCWRSESGVNCGSCERCLKTMSILVALDALEKCTAFRAEDFRLEKVARIFVRSRNLRSLLELEKFARQRGKPRLARALRHARYRCQIRHAGQWVLQQFRQRRLLPELTERLEKRLLANAIS